MSGPVSARLRSELAREISQHGIVVWLDRDGHYTRFVDALRQEQLPFQVAAYRDSFLELMLTLEPLGDRATREPLLIHLPGFHEDDVKRGPLLELWLLGRRFRKALPTLIREAAHGAATAEELEARAAALTLEEADAWLAALQQGPTTTLETWLAGLSVLALVDELGRPGDIATAAAAQWPALWRWLERQLGVDQAWCAALGLGHPVNAEITRLAVASWALCVEYVHDLQRLPYEPKLLRLRDLPRPMVSACEELAAHLRAVAPDAYRAVATELEPLLEVERRQARASDLGRIDTFSFEEEQLLVGALDALQEERWAEALAWAEPRLAERSFWTSGAAAWPRRNAWVLVQEAARLGAALSAAGPALEPGPAAFSSLEEATQRYVRDGAAVDRAHRQLLQQRAARLSTQTPQHDRLRGALQLLRDAWRTWADDWSRDLGALMGRVGPLPGEDLQQRHLFEQVVLPEVQRDKRAVAWFLVDALRYELATELVDRLSQEADTQVSLQARLAELPTLTAVGMNALAPVVREGKLHIRIVDGKISGFSAGTFVVDSPAARRRVISDRVGGGPIPWLDLRQVLEAPPGELREAARRPLLVVHSEEIDRAGEHGGGLRTYEAAVGMLVEAWRRLREAGVKTFIFTADHGFLLPDEADPGAQPHGRTSTPSRRHALSTFAADQHNELRVPLADLGYADDDGQHVIFPSSTTVFKTGAPPKDFAHGGPTLQERVIPVLTLSHRRPSGSTAEAFRVEAELLPPIAGMYRLRARVGFAATLALAFTGKARLQLTLDSPDGDDVLPELVDASGGEVTAGGVQLTVDEPCELFFRLSAASERKVQVRLHHTGSATVEPWVSTERLLAPARALRADQAEQNRQTERTDQTEQIVPGPPRRSWLDDLPAMWRPAFEHLERFGDLGEDTLATLLGGPRPARLFALQFDKLAAICPFTIEIRATGGTKRYVRSGGAS